jgi:hypothetical protein
MKLFNEKLAVKVTQAVSSMYCAYFFALLALISLPEAIHLGLYALIGWVAQTFLQLVLLSIIMVGQNIQSRESNAKLDAILEKILQDEEEELQTEENILLTLNTKV